MKSKTLFNHRTSIRLTLWSLLCLFLSGWSVEANAQEAVSVGAQITAENQIVSGKAYVLRHGGNGTVLPYVVDNGTNYDVPTSQNSATEASVYYLISNGNGTWKIKNYYTGKYWGVPVNDTALAPVEENAAGAWSLNFSGGVTYPTAPDASNDAQGINRKSQKIHMTSGKGTGNANKVYIYEVPDAAVLTSPVNITSGWYQIKWVDTNGDTNTDYTSDDLSGKYVRNYSTEVTVDAQQYPLYIDNAPVNNDEAAASLVYFEKVGGSGAQGVNGYLRSANGHYVTQTGAASASASSQNYIIYRSSDTPNYSTITSGYSGNRYSLIPRGKDATPYIGQTAQGKFPVAEFYAINPAYFGLQAWKVEINDIADDIQVTYTGEDAYGIKNVYNGGTFFLTKGVTPSASDFSAPNNNYFAPDFIIDEENHLIKVNYFTGKVFTISHADRGSIIYNPSASKKYVWSSGKSGTFNASNANSQWVIYPTGTDGQYYLYNVGAGKFAIPTSRASGSSNSWVFSPSAVAVQFIHQDNGTFKIQMANAPVSGANQAYMAISNNYTGPIINYNDEGGNFTITKVAGTDASAAVNAAVAKLVKNQEKLTSYPQASGWYTIQIKSSGTASYVGRYLKTSETLYNNLYPLTFTGAVDVQPAINDASFFTYIDYTSWDVNTWQLPDGRYLVNNGNNKFPTPSLTPGNVLCGYSNGNYFKEANNYYADPYNNNANYFIGETTIMRTAYTVYPIDLEAAGIAAWKVVITNNKENPQVTCSRDDVCGLATVYNNGHIFLPTGITPTNTDFTISNDDDYFHRFVIDAEEKTITVDRGAAATAIDTKAALTTGWYLLKMSAGTQPGKFAFNNSNEQNYNSDRYPLTYQGTAAIPTANNAWYYVRILHDDVTADVVQMQAANGHYLDVSAKASMTAVDLNLTVVENEGFRFAGYFKPFNSGENRIIGKTDQDTDTRFVTYAVDPATEGLTAWQVSIDNATISDYVTCTNTNVVGLTSVYNNGYFFLPNDVTPLTSDFTCNGRSAVFTINTEAKTISTEPYIHSIATKAGPQLTGVGNSNAILERIKVETGSSIGLKKFYVTLKGDTKDRISRLAVYETRTNQFNATIGTVNSRLLGETSTISSDDIEITLDYKKTLNPGYYLWLVADINNNDALIGTTVAARATAFDYTVDGGSTSENYSIDNDPAGTMTIFKTQSFVFVPSNTDTEYYRIPAIAIDNAGGIVAFSDLRHISTEDIGKSPAHNIDVVARRSTDSGKTWGAATYVAQVNAGTQGDNFGYGDAAVARAVNGDLVCLMAGGTKSFPAGMTQLYLTKSTDNGQTWSTPIDIFPSINKNGLSISSIFTTSGSGLCTSNGHLMFVAVTKHQGDGTYYNHILESSDNGDTWQLKPAVAYTGSDESKVIERLDGSLLMSVRSAGYGAAAYRGFNVSTDMGETWGTQYQNPTIWGNGSDHDIIYYSGASAEYPKGVMLHTMCNNGGRQKLTLYISLDGGETWALAYEIQKGLAAYTCMKVLADGSLGILFEDGSLRDKGDEYAINFLTLSSSQMTSLISKAKDMLALETNSTYKIKNYGNNKFISKNAEENTNNVLMTTTESDAATFILIPSKLQAGFYYLYDTQSGYFLTADNSTTGVSARWTYSTSTPTAFMIRESDAMSTLYTLGAISAASNSDTGNYLGNYDQGYPNRSDNHWYIVKAAENAVVDITAVTSNIESFVNSAAAAGTQLKYTATVGTAARGTLVIPFDADVPGETVEAYTLESVDGSDHIHGTKVTTIEANKPVLLKNSDTIVLTAKSGTLAYTENPTNGLLHGVYTRTAVPNGSYVLQNQAEYGVAFYLVNTSVATPSVNAFRAYLTAGSNTARALTFSFGEETTGINSIDNGQLIMDNGAVYDLQGRKVSEASASSVNSVLPKGLYIINGKKVVIK